MEKGNFATQLLPSAINISAPKHYSLQVTHLKHSNRPASKPHRIPLIHRPLSLPPPRLILPMQPILCLPPPTLQDRDLRPNLLLLLPHLPLWHHQTQYPILHTSFNALLIYCAGKCEGTVEFTDETLGEEDLVAVGRDPWHGWWRGREWGGEVSRVVRVGGGASMCGLGRRWWWCELLLLLFLHQRLTISLHLTLSALNILTHPLRPRPPRLPIHHQRMIIVRLDGNLIDRCAGDVAV